MRSVRPDTVVGGRITLNEILLKSVSVERSINITNMVDSFNLFENIFTNTLTGNMSIGDTGNLIANFPIVGHEEIHITMGTPNIERVQTKKFRIYKVTDVNNQNLGLRRYSIHLLSNEFFTNLKGAVSRSFSKSTTSSIADKIFRTDLESDKEFDIEETQNVYDIVIPNWKPFDAMNWLAKRSMAEHRDGANYMFYETREGFHFRSLESLAEEESVGVYRRQPSNTTDGDPDEEQYRNVNRIEIVNSFDMVANIPNGMYANRLVIHDMINRKTETLDYNYSKEYDKMIHVEENKKNNNWRLSDTENMNGQGSSMMVHETADELTSSPLSKQTLVSRFDDTNTYYEKTLQNRISQMQQINNVKLNITISGDTTRKVGDVLELMIPSVEPSISGSVPMDKMYNGRYLVTGLRHKIDNASHLMVMEVVKDSYFSSLPTE
jgi:hypothetical protein